MPRSFAVKSALSIAAGASIVLLSPPALHAVAATPSAAITAGRDLYGPVFFAAYPGTPAGHAACAAEGSSLTSPPGGQYFGYTCSYGDPFANDWNLWLDPRP